MTGRFRNIGQATRCMKFPAIAALVAVAACSLPGMSLAADKPKPKHTDWARQPSGDEFAEAYPKIASALGIEGKVVLNCGVSAEGVLQHCASQSEKPAGLGFGEAARGMSSLFRTYAASKDNIAFDAQCACNLWVGLRELVA